MSTFIKFGRRAQKERARRGSVDILLRRGRCNADRGRDLGEASFIEPCPDCGQDAGAEFQRRDGLLEPGEGIHDSGLQPFVSLC